MKNAKVTSTAKSRCAGRKKKRGAWSKNMIKNTPERHTESESQAQSSRPRPLATEMIPTILAATRGGTPLISPAIGAACEIMLIPAVTFRKRTAQRAYHCQVDRSRCRVKSRVASRACFFAEGCQPSGTQPGGGFFITDAPATTMTK